MSRSQYDASVVITTRNRRNDLLRAIRSCLAQTDCNVEVLVFDDASDDGTAEAIGNAFPEVRVFATRRRKGYIWARNRGFQAAETPYVFSIDDDAYFADPTTIAATIKLFERYETVGAVAIPYVEPYNRRSLSSLRSPTKLSPGQELRNYVGCAHALRRDAALALRGYREFFVHQGEERDLCIRLWDAGWRIIYGDVGKIVHTVSPNREADRVNYYGARNQILFNWLNVPFSAMLVRMIWDPWAILRYRFAWSCLPGKTKAFAAGYLESLRHFGERRPVSWKVYRNYRRLPAHGPEEWEGTVPAACGRVEQLPDRTTVDYRT